MFSYRNKVLWIAQIAARIVAIVLKICAIIFLILWLVGISGGTSLKETMLLVISGVLMIMVATCRKFVLYIKRERGEI